MNVFAIRYLSLFLLFMLIRRAAPLSRSIRMSSSSIKVTSYNVLSSSLCEPSYYPFCTVSNLDQNNRLEKVKNKLNKEIQNRSIICLQEISQEWAGKLHPFFAAQGYYLITALYGHRFNGYMGVATAIPLSEYNIVKVDIKKASDAMTKKPSVKPHFIKQFLQNLVFSVLKFLRLYRDPAPSACSEAARRNNEVIAVTLERKESNKPFVVGNYHMPCMFKLPSVMLMHCALYAKLVSKLANGLPYLLAGDFNIRPDSSMYTMFTTGKSEIDLPGECDIWNPVPCTIDPVISAYAQVNGKEPKFTNFARNKDAAEPFKDTLDYIFVSKEQWQVEGVDELPTEESGLKGPLPNDEEPSDHLAISATLSLK